MNVQKILLGLSKKSHSTVLLMRCRFILFRLRSRWIYKIL